MSSSKRVKLITNDEIFIGDATWIKLEFISFLIPINNVTQLMNTSLCNLFEALLSNAIY